MGPTAICLRPAQTDFGGKKSKGASIKYVRTKGGRGVQKSADFVDKQSYGDADKGEGVQNPEKDPLLFVKHILPESGNFTELSCIYLTNSFGTITHRK